MATPKIPPFAEDEIEFDQYIMLLEAIFSTHLVTEEARKKGWLMMGLGTKHFSTLCNLTAPDPPTAKTYSQLVELLKGHFVTKPSYHKSLCEFQQRKKQAGESVKEMFADLKGLANNCNFGASYDLRLRDQLFMAVDGQNYFKFLMSEDLGLDSLTSQQLLERVIVARERTWARTV